jgi:hypothetical protein
MVLDVHALQLGPIFRKLNPGLRRLPLLPLKESSAVTYPKHTWVDVKPGALVAYEFQVRVPSGCKVWGHIITPEPSL